MVGGVITDIQDDLAILDKLNWNTSLIVYFDR